MNTSIPQGPSLPSPAPPALPGLLPLGHYCFNKPASAYLQVATASVARSSWGTPVIDSLPWEGV